MAHVQIFFGSQTGTAECFAEELSEEAQREGIRCEVLDLQTFTPESFASRKIVMFVVSTYGEGEPTDNAVRFYRWATDPRNDGALKGQRFTVMGLGDMNYSKFNNMGMQCDMSLERLGGTRIYKRGVGDDSQDIQADFKHWREGGLWAALRKAVADVASEGGFAATEGESAVLQVKEIAAVKSEVHFFFAEDGAGGVAKSVCESVVAELRSRGSEVAISQTLSDRKAVEAVRKLPRRSVVAIVADCGSDGLCSAGLKLVRNMSLELDVKFHENKGISLAFFVVSSSPDSASASSRRPKIEESAQCIPRAFERLGIAPLAAKSTWLVDLAVDKLEPTVSEFADAVAAASNKPACADPGAAAKGAAAGDAALTPAAVESRCAKKTKVLCAGPEALEAGEALASAWPGGGASCEAASLAALSAAARERVHVVLAVECAADGGLSDAARALAAQLGAANLGVKVSLKQLRFALLAVAGTHYGNAGERASANAMREELTRATLPLVDTLRSIESCCLASTSIDLQSLEGGDLVKVGEALASSLSETTPSAVAAAPTKGFHVASPATATAVELQLKIAENASSLGLEVAGEASDVLARFYFEADKCKVAKVRELRQLPDHAGGLGTAEIEFEASGNLKDYTLGGTLSLLPENDPADVEAAMQLMGLPASSASHVITFIPKGGITSNMKIKKPFPTPCTLRDALARYCDLSHAPSKKMLAAMQPKLKSESARECVSKLLEHPEMMKALHDSSLCCRMNEFWAMLGVEHIDPVDFLLHCPRQKPREFTIASSPKATPQRITLCVSMTSHEVHDVAACLQRLVDAGCLPAGSTLPSRSGRFFGTCSRWLTTRIQAGDTALAKQRPSALRLPAKDVPLVMIGAGAGVAPFRGFWEELRRGSQAAPAALFFGCRHPEQDWLFRDEMSSAVKLNTGCGALARMQVGPKRPLTCLFTAFSRPGDGKEGKYVQNHLRDQAASVKHWVEKMSGCVYICGSTAMGNAVLDVLADLLEGGRQAVDALRSEGRIVAEMWG